MAGETTAAATTATTTTATTAATTTAAAPIKAEGITQTATTETKAAATDGGDILTGDAPATETKPGSEATASEIDVKVPEGIELDDATMGDFKSLAKELGLKSEGAQKLVDLSAKMQKSYATKAETAWNETKAEWRKQAETDKEIGGAKFAENAVIARRAIEKFGGPELKKALNELGLGNHPEVIRFAYRVGKAISEDSVATPGSAPTVTDDEARLREAYPSMYK